MPLDASVTLDATTWAALALVLTLIGAAFAWVSWRRRGPAAGLRGLAWALLPIAAWLTGTLKLAANILDEVVGWATRLAFSPVVWLGLVVAAVAVALWVLSGVMLARGIGVRDAGRAKPSTRTKQVPAAEPPGRKAAATSRAREDDLDDMADIEAILKKHGI
jgi:hypothetical protein